MENLKNYQNSLKEAYELFEFIKDQKEHFDKTDIENLDTIILKLENIISNKLDLI